MRWRLRQSQQPFPLLDEDDNSPAIVALTGSTGNLGCYLLDALANNPRVLVVYCLNRSEDAQTRQASLLSARGLKTDIHNNEKIHFYRYDLLDGDNLGIDEGAANKIASTATHFIHCAWPVDWNRSYSSFEPSVRGVSALIAFLQRGSAELFFISSIAVAGNWGSVPGARLEVPEEELEDWKVARFGYGQAKLVAERVIARAGGGLTAAICRVGQISGPVLHDGGRWPEQEWLPSMLSSCRYLGLIPSTLGPLNDVDWVPVDHAAAIICELLFLPQSRGSTVYHHLVHPSQRPWQDLLGPVQATLPSAKVIDLDEWVQALEGSANTTGTVNEIPALKLLPFFQDLADKFKHIPKARSAHLSTKRTIQRTKTLASLPPISAEWMSLWIQQLSL